MSGFSPIQATALREQVVEQVRTAIIEGQLKPNDHIIEKDLTEQLGVSRTPVREALILLEREGLIVSYPNRGSFVREFSVEDVDMIFSMRTALENFAGELSLNRLDEDDWRSLERSTETQRQAIERGDAKSVRSIDMRFHEYLMRKSNHPLLIRSWHEIVAQIAALLYLRQDAMPDYDEYLAVSDHQRIITAYRTRDIEALRTANHDINNRVAGECRFAVETLKKPENT